MSYADEPALTPSEPRVLAGRYRLDSLIGRGGMGSVYAGEQLALGRPCALKLLEGPLCQHEVARLRFVREARRAGRIVHENVVAVTDYDVSDGVPFLVMELLVGETLRTLLRREGALALARALQIALQICRGLAAAHTLGTVHRDVTPNNVYLTRRADGSELVKLLDFGIAKSMDESDDLTADGMVLGTVRYMAPEQLHTPGVVDVRADVYAAGLLLYEMLAGQPACASRDLHAAMQQTLYERPRALSELRPQLPDALLTVVERAIAPEPERRFASIDEFRGALEAWELAPGQAGVARDMTTRSVGVDRPPAALSVGPRRARKSALRGALLALTAVALAGLWLRSSSWASAPAPAGPAPSTQPEATASLPPAPWSPATPASPAVAPSGQPALQIPAPGAGLEPSAKPRRSARRPLAPEVTPALSPVPAAAELRAPALGFDQDNPY